MYAKRSDVKCDLANLDAFPDDYASVAVAVHVIEHFYEWDVANILAEWRRVLKPGGKLILELPSMNKIFNYIRDCMTDGENINLGFSWYAIYGDPRCESVPMCHKWGYTEQMITDKLTAAGFSNIHFEEPNYHFPLRDMRVVAYK